MKTTLFHIFKQFELYAEFGLNPLLKSQLFSKMSKITNPFVEDPRVLTKDLLKSSNLMMKSSRFSVGKESSERVKKEVEVSFAEDVSNTNLEKKVDVKSSQVKSLHDIVKEDKQIYNTKLTQLQEFEEKIILNREGQEIINIRKNTIKFAKKK